MGVAYLHFWSRDRVLRGIVVLFLGYVTRVEDPRDLPGAAALSIRVQHCYAILKMTVRTRANASVFCVHELITKDFWTGSYHPCLCVFDDGS